MEGEGKARYCLLVEGIEGEVSFGGLMVLGLGWIVWLEDGRLEKREGGREQSSLCRLLLVWGGSLIRGVGGEGWGVGV